MPAPPLPPGFTIRGGPPLPAGYKIRKIPSNRPPTDYIDAAKESGLSDRQDIIHAALRMARDDNNEFAVDTLKGQLGVALKAAQYQAKQKVVEDLAAPGLTAFGEGARHSIRRAWNLIGGASDQEVAEANEALDPLFAKYPGSAMLGHGAIEAPAAFAVTPGAGAATGVLGRIANVAKQVAGGAGTGFVFSDPGARAQGAAVGGGTNLVASAFTNPLHALAKSSEPRANRIATRMFAQSPQDLAEIEAAQSIKAGRQLPQREAYETAGRQLRDLGVTKIGQGDFGRAVKLGKYAEDAGRELSAVLAEADRQGISINKPALVSRLYQAMSKHFPKEIRSAPGDMLAGELDAIEFMQWLHGAPGQAQGVKVSNSEMLKRLMQKEAKFTSSARNLTPGSPDTAAQGWFKEASALVREAVEQAIEGGGGPDLIDRFLKAKNLYGTAAAFNPMAEQAARKGFLGMGDWAGASPSGMFFRSAVQKVKRPFQPFGIKASEGLDWLYRKTPAGTDARLQAFLSNLLRNPKYEGEPNAP